MRQLVLILALLGASIAVSWSQEVRLYIKDKPLNEALKGLDVDISFDDKALSAYKVTVSQTFPSAEEAVRYLLKDKPFKVEKMGNVLVISPFGKVISEGKPLVPKKYIISGVLYDESNGEALPYAYIRTRDESLSTNESGRFSIARQADSPLMLRVEYMGYEPLDTILYAGNYRLSLSPASFILEEVVIDPSPSAMLMQVGLVSGEIRINHRTARYMPGSADNSVFNLLRMMPGVRASGEPSDDLIVRGSNWGESRLVFDGFSIFGMKSHNDLIGSVNPYMAKDIRLLKGGYDASQGNHVGAIAEVTGSDGNFNKPSVRAGLSNSTINAYISLPINNNAALSAAYRQTFYELYDNESIGKGSNDHNDSEIYIEPDYRFRDFNVKYAGNAFDNDHYYISLYGADDRFDFSAEQESYQVEAGEHNKQFGAAAAYDKQWKGGSGSKLLFSYSTLSADVDNVSAITGGKANAMELFEMENKVQELSFKLEHQFNIGQKQQIQVGGEWQYYETSLNGSRSSLHNPSLYVSDHISLGQFSLDAGIRADWTMEGKFYFQPRLSARYAFTEELTATASFGLYNQFLMRMPYQYDQNSYQLVWNLSDSLHLSSVHAQAGLAYSRNGWLLSAEAFVRKTDNQPYFVDNSIETYDNTLAGFDLFLKKEWQRQSFFASYSLVNTAYPQEATGQEVKMGAIASLKAFHLSATFVYGSGFPYLATGGHGHSQGNHNHSTSSGSTSSDKDYSRFDLALIYKVRLGKAELQAGLSVLNLFDRDNVKYSYRLSDQNNVFNIYTKATPFTPLVFVELVL